MTNEDAMYGAIARRDVESVRQLAVDDPSVLFTFVVNKSWLHWAAQSGHIEVMEALVNAGLPIDVLTKDGYYSPLNVAAGQGQHLACEWLINRGADINQGLGSSSTPIFGAIYSKSLELVRLFIKHGADLCATFSESKIDVISYAMDHGTPEIVDYLQKCIGSPK